VKGKKHFNHDTFAREGQAHVKKYSIAEFGEAERNLIRGGPHPVTARSRQPLYIPKMTSFQDEQGDADGEKSRLH
jgi:hypothetical protein